MSHLYQTYNRSKLSFHQGRGPWLFDNEGRKFFDFGAGIGVTAFGHANERLNRVLSEQAAKLWHVSNLYTIEHQEALARVLCEISFAEFVFFTNSGAEAVECALKTARRYHYSLGRARSKIISFEGCFHGRTMATITLADTPKMVEGFGPLIPDFIKVPLTEEGLASELDENTAAVIIEPIIGEGGIIAIPESFLAHIRREADRVGALVIFDEIQCGLGRSGKMFAHELSGVVPDIMTLAKGIGGGFPLGACLSSAKVGASMIPGTHGSTYGGNPLACRVGLEVIEMMREPGFMEQVNRLSGHLQHGLDRLIVNYPEIFDGMRGVGLMRGLKSKVDITAFIETGRKNGVLTVPAADNVIRLLPALNLTLGELEEGIKLLEGTAEKMKGKL